MIMDNFDYLIETSDDFSLDIIEEAYKGKSRDLLNLEKMIGENRKKYYSTFKVGGSYYTDKDFIKIGDKIADIFGFKVCDFNLVNDPAPNAFTVPCGISMRYNNVYTVYNYKELAKNKSNIKFKTADLSMFIRVTSGLWTNKKFTDAEVTAIIIHEVGHNFQQEYNDAMRNYMSFLYFLNLFQNIFTLLNPATMLSGIVNIINNDSELRSKVNKNIKDSEFGGAINIGGNILGFIRMTIYEVMELAGRATLGIPTGLISIGDIIISASSNPIGTIIGIALKPINRSRENIADTFASDHGYGAELISALTKMDIDPEASATAVGRICKKMPLFDSVCTLFALPSIMVSNLFSDHPMTGKRASNIVIELEKQMNKSDISPKMKKEMQAQINEVKKVIENYSKVDNPMQGTALRRALLGFTTNFDRDPKGFIQKAFSKNELKEAFENYEDELFIDSIEESIYFDLI